MVAGAYKIRPSVAARKAFADYLRGQAQVGAASRAAEVGCVPVEVGSVVDRAGAGAGAGDGGGFAVVGARAGAWTFAKGVRGEDVGGEWKRARVQSGGEGGHYSSYGMLTRVLIVNGIVMNENKMRYVE